MPTYRVAAGPSYCTQQIGRYGASSSTGGATNTAGYGFGTQNRVSQINNRTFGRVREVKPKRLVGSGLKYTGAYSFDEAWGITSPTDWRPNVPAQNEIGLVSPPRFEVTDSWMSKWGIDLSTGAGGYGDNVFPTIVGDYVYYQFFVQAVFGGGALGSQLRIFVTDVASGMNGLPVAGAIALSIRHNAALQPRLRFQYYDGANWIDGPLGGVNVGIITNAVLLELHVPTGQCKLFLTNSSGGGVVEDEAAAMTSPNIPLVCDVGAFQSDQYTAGALLNTMRFHEYMRGEGVQPSDRPPHGKPSAFGNLPDVRHALAYYPITIGDSNSWSVERVCNEAEKWRAVRDPMYARVPTVTSDVPTSVFVTGDGSTIDQLFGIDFVAADWPDATIDGVYIACAKNPGGGFVFPDFVIAKQNGVTVQHSDFASGNITWRYGWLPTAPDGTAWTPTKLEQLQIGVRNVTNLSAQKASLIMCGVVGTNLGRPPVEDECPWMPGWTPNDVTVHEFLTTVVNY